MTAVMLSGCDVSGSKPVSAANDKTLVVGVRKNLTRFSVYNEEYDQYIGFEVDLAHELANALGYNDVVFMGLHSNEREAALDTGAIDCLIAAYSWREERNEKYALSPPYFMDHGRILVENSTLFTDWSDLRGKKVGYITSSDSKNAFINRLVEEPYIKDQADAENFCIMVSKNSYSDIMSAVEIGTLDAARLDGSIAIGFMDDEMSYLTDKVYSDEYYCVATRKESAIAEDVENAVALLYKDGVIAKLEEKWALNEGLEEEAQYEDE